VEYQIKGITQIPSTRKGLTFARGLRSILRHDPDKIMVGEIRDQETAQIAINARSPVIWCLLRSTPITCWTCSAAS